MALHDLMDRLAQLANLFKAFATPTPVSERLDLCFRLSYTGAKPGLCGLGMAHRTHHSTPLHPTLTPATCLNLHRHLAFITFGNALDFAVGRLSPHRAQGDISALHRFQSRF